MSFHTHAPNFMDPVSKRLLGRAFVLWVSVGSWLLPITAAETLRPTESNLPAIHARSTNTAVRRVLFIGNSLTYWQQGIYLHLERLAASGETPTLIHADKCVKGGATLKTHWERPEPRAMIAQGGWTEVVVQEDLPEINVSYFREHARNFVGEIRKVKARPVLLMAWPYARLDWIGTDTIAEEHRKLAKELGIDVAPVALAWRTSLQQRPDLDLFAADQEHPSLLGTYLATSVVYATLSGNDPRPLRYVPAELREADAAYLRRIAWETVRRWNP